MNSQQINFTLNDGKYVALVQLSDVAALHIEREAAGNFSAKQSSLPASYNPAFANLEGLSDCCFMPSVMDFELAFAVYPKFIELRSATPIKKAYLITQ
jgi:hypothetical protein